MKKTALAVAFLLSASPAFAQFGGLDKVVRGAETAKKVADIKLTDHDERVIGEHVSAMLIDRFGIMQDPAVAKYVTLVGTVLAQASSRPNIDWKFIVLDTEGVNAYAAPGGFVHITKGALGLIKSEAELAGVLGHEIVHVSAKHTVKAIQKSRATSVGTDLAGSQAGVAGELAGVFATLGYDIVFNNKWNRDDENESDRVGSTIANTVGYSPLGMVDFLNHVTERNKGKNEPNGLFASHPQTKDRIERITRAIKDGRLTATAKVEDRYRSVIKFDAKPVTEIAAIDEGARGALGGGSSTSAKAEPKKEEPKKEEAKKEEPKKKGFGLGSLTSSLSGGKQADSTQAGASGGGRMGVPDTNAPGGPNKTPVRVSISAADIAEFKKGIA